MQNLINAVREHSRKKENYLSGWDIIEECYTDNEVLELISGSETEKEAIAVVAKAVGIIDSHRKEIESTIW